MNAPSASFFCLSFGWCLCTAMPRTSTSTSMLVFVRRRRCSALRVRWFAFDDVSNTQQHRRRRRSDFLAINVWCFLEVLCGLDDRPSRREQATPTYTYAYREIYLKTKRFDCYNMYHSTLQGTCSPFFPCVGLRLIVLCSVLVILRVDRQTAGFLCSQGNTQNLDIKYVAHNEYTRFQIWDFPGDYDTSSGEASRD